MGRRRAVPADEGHKNARESFGIYVSEIGNVAEEEKDQDKAGSGEDRSSAKREKKSLAVVGPIGRMGQAGIHG